MSFLSYSRLEAANDGGSSSNNSQENNLKRAFEKAEGMERN